MLRAAKCKRSYFFVFSFSLILLSSSAFAKELIVGFSYAKPPYVLAQSTMQVGETRGIELEIMRKALAVSGHTFKPRYFAYNNLHNVLKAGKVDAVATVRPEQKGQFYSENFVYFHNFAITKKPDQHLIVDVESLSSRTIAAWQGAKKDLGVAFEQAVQASPIYKEIGDQQQQVLLFLHGRVDTLVIDGAIFKYWAKMLGHKSDDYTFHDIFGGKTNFVAAFAEKAIRDDFNKGLQALKTDHSYHQIFKKYENP